MGSHHRLTMLAIAACLARHGVVLPRRLSVRLRSAHAGRLLQEVRTDQFRQPRQQLAAAADVRLVEQRFFVAVHGVFADAHLGGDGTAARIELDAALMRATNPLLRDDTEFYKQFVQNDSFKRFVTDAVRSIAATGRL